MYCKKCGSKIDNDSKFCTFCGTKQSEINIPNNNIANNNNQFKGQSVESEYDLSYSTETEATFLGIVLFIINISLYFFQPITFDDIEDYNQWKVFAIISSFIIRVLITIYVVNIAKRQNRDTTIWGVIAFLFPTITLIIIGLLKKINIKLNINHSLSNEENSFLLTEKAKEFLDNENYNECIRFSEKAINLNPNNKDASNILMQAKLKNSSYTNFK